MKGIDYLCLLIYKEPGNNQRYYLRKLYEYMNNKKDPSNGSNGSYYFRYSGYKNNYWYDYAEPTIPYKKFGKVFYRPSESKMFISNKGLARLTSKGVL